MPIAIACLVASYGVRALPLLWPIGYSLIAGAVPLYKVVAAGWAYVRITRYVIADGAFSTERKWAWEGRVECVDRVRLDEICLVVRFDERTIVLLRHAQDEHPVVINMEGLREPHALAGSLVSAMTHPASGQHLRAGADGDEPVLPT